jgi:hypothetical protein
MVARSRMGGYLARPNAAVGENPADKPGQFGIM